MFYVTGLALVAGTVIGLASGGRLRFLPRHRLRAWWLVIAGFGLQLATDRFSIGFLGTALPVAGATALLAFAALNPNLVGIGVVAVGVAANALVIGLNGGMPVRSGAVVAAHVATRAQEPVLNYGSRHHREVPRDRLRPLADTIPVPLFKEVLSVGDLILAVGVTATIARLFHPVARHLAGSGVHNDTGPAKRARPGDRARTTVPDAPGRTQLPQRAQNPETVAFVPDDSTETTDTNDPPTSFQPG